MFKKPVINKIVTNMNNLTIYLRAPKKWGKTTLFRDTVLEKFHDPSRGLLIGIGSEMGYSLLDNLNCTHCDTWQDLVEIKDWLITQKGKEHNIEMVAFDVVDELFPIVEKEVIRQSNIENKKQVSSIKAAYGGFNAGATKVAEMVKKYFRELKEAGFGTWKIAHTKYKNMKEKDEVDDGYQCLTSTFNSTYEGVFGDIDDCVLTGCIDRAITDEEIDMGNDTKTIHHATDEIRKLYFRGTTSIDAGCRFTNGAVPEFMVFDKSNMAKDFIHVLEEGMRKSRTTDTVDETTFKKIQAKDAIENEKETNSFRKSYMQKKESVDSSAENAKQMLEIIKKSYKNATSTQIQQIKEILQANKISKLNMQTDINVLKTIANVFNN